MPTRKVGRKKEILRGKMVSGSHWLGCRIRVWIRPNQQRALCSCSRAGIAPIPPVRSFPARPPPPDFRFSIFGIVLQENDLMHLRGWSCSYPSSIIRDILQLSREEHLLGRLIPLLPVWKCLVDRMQYPGGGDGQCNGSTACLQCWIDHR